MKQVTKNQHFNLPKYINISMSKKINLRDQLISEVAYSLKYIILIYSTHLLRSLRIQFLAFELIAFIT